MRVRNIYVYLLIISCSVTVCLAQKKQNVYFFKNNGRQVDLKDSADYLRVIQEPDSGSKFFTLLEYYKNGSKKRLGKVSKFEPYLVYEETLITYYEDGKRKEVTQYTKGIPKGTQFRYHPNGKLMENSVNITLKNDPNKLKFLKKIISYHDSTGLAIIEGGTGIYKTFDNSAILMEEGNYLDSVKHGIWKGRYTLTGAYYEESFDRGKFLTGIVKFKNGDSTRYNKAEEMPEFNGGMDKFYRYVAQNFKYPRAAIESGVNGKVIVHFEVETDGSMSNLKLESDPGFGIGKEAMRVVKDSPKWIPGRQHGIPVKVSYYLPIKIGIK